MFSPKGECKACIDLLLSAISKLQTLSTDPQHLVYSSHKFPHLIWLTLWDYLWKNQLRGSRAPLQPAPHNNRNNLLPLTGRSARSTLATTFDYSIRFTLHAVHCSSWNPWKSPTHRAPVATLGFYWPFCVELLFTCWSAAMCDKIGLENWASTAQRPTSRTGLKKMTRFFWIL